MAKKPKNKDPREQITYTQSFAGVIRVGEDGKKKLVVKSQRWYNHQIQKFKVGEEVSLMLHNEKPKRTGRQNRYYWGVFLPLIAKETGEGDLDRLHELFKGKFLTEGVVEVLGEKVRMKKSSTDLSTGEFSEYIMNIEELTAVEAPPTENYDLPALARKKSEVEYPEEDLGDGPAF